MGGLGQLLIVETEILDGVGTELVTSKIGSVGSLLHIRVTNVYSHCSQTKDTSDGQVVIDVDDFVEGGHRRAMENFHEKVPLWQICCSSVNWTRKCCSSTDESHNIRVVVSLRPWMSM